MIRNLTAVLLLFFAASAVAQQPEFPSPQKEHEWLKQFTGEWTSVSKTAELPDMPVMECKGAMSSKMLGGFWVVNKLQGDMNGATFHAIQVIGYDTEKKKYVGTWVDSMMNHMWKYEGHIDDTGKKLLLVAEGPNFMAGGKLTKFRDSYEFTSADTIIATAEMMGEDGKWFTFMTGEMKRVNAKNNDK